MDAKPLSHDVVASVVPVTNLLLSKNMSPDKSAVFLRCHSFSAGSNTPFTSTTEPVPVVGDAGRWFAVALEIPENTTEAMIYVCITPVESYTPLTEIAVARVDMQTLVKDGRLRMIVDPSSPELKLVICARDRPSPLLDSLMSNTIQAAYAFPLRNTILREVCGEVKFGYTVPAEFLAQRISELQTRIEQFEYVLKSAREAQGIFSSDKEAVLNGYYPCAIRIIGVRALEQVQRLPGSKTLSSPFVAVSVKSPRFTTQKQVGRTNTEYRTADPVFGTNENVQLAEHAKPVTDFECGRFGRIGNDGIWIETYLRDDETLTFTVFHERHSVYQGLTNSPMCTATINFQELSVSSSNTREITLRNTDNQSLAGGVLLAVAYLRDKPSTNPFDLITTTDTGEVVPNSCKGDEFPNLLRIPTYWLSRLMVTLNSHLQKLNLMAEEIEKRRSGSSRCFKSSNDKRKLPLGSITTNLHQVEYSVASTQSPFETRSRYAYTTCGVPSALALGVDNLAESLYSLGARRAELEAEVSRLTKLVGSFDLVTVAFRSHELLSYGAELNIAHCPLTPPCQKPRLDVDDSCGSSYHRERSAPASSAARSTSNSLRSAAASIATRFTSAAPPASSPVQAEASQDKKVVQPASWQTLVELQQDLALRETVAVSQSLAPLASSFIAEALLTLQRGPRDAKAWGDQLKTAGFLVGWESLISTHGKEMSMLADVIAVVNFVNTNCKFRCRGTDDPKQSYAVNVEIDGSSKELVLVTVSFPLEEFTQLFELENGIKHVDLSLFVVLFSQGVNETQSISNYINKEWASKQAEINRASIQRLMQYALLFNKTVPLPVLRLNAIIENQREDEKEVDVLLLAEDAVRSLKGARQIMCKSGKDRTAMAVTLEQSRIGAASLNSSNVREIANLMREFGVRISIAEKNVGSRMYSFNMIQRMALPRDYRPPTSVIQDMATSYSKKDS